jgi:O-antigen ligase
MVAAHPVFGIGPGGFRLHYGTYLKPRQGDWDRRILANSLPLEIVADLGLLGGGLFFALLAAILRALLLALRYGQVVAWWQIALIGSMAAFLGHGLVDYILISNAIFFLFWLLCGLATAASDVLPGDLRRP